MALRRTLSPFRTLLPGYQNWRARTAINSWYSAPSGPLEASSTVLLRTSGLGSRRRIPAYTQFTRTTIAMADPWIRISDFIAPAPRGYLRLWPRHDVQGAFR
jgi:hypothetical protein